MKNKTVTTIVVIVLALIGIGVIASKNNSKKDNTSHDKMVQDEGSKPSKKSSTEVQETSKITYKGFDVVEKHIKVKKGTTVTWTNEDSAKHDVTPDKETDEFKASDLFGIGETRSVTFNTVGTYAYHCSPHPYMKGTVEVIE